LCRRCGSGSAPNVAAVAALLYLATYGARAPLLALLGLRRLPNLVLVIAPYAVTVPLAFAASDRLDPAPVAGLVALVLAPGALFAPAVVSAAGGRRSDMAGALVLGTVIVSIVLVATRPGTGAAAFAAAQAFLAGPLVASALPTVRDRARVPLQWSSVLATLAIIAFALGTAPRIDPVTFVVAFAALVLTLVIAGRRRAGATTRPLLRGGCRRHARSRHRGRARVVDRRPGRDSSAHRERRDARCRRRGGADPPALVSVRAPTRDDGSCPARSSPDQP
jgi:hypothetical protein